LSIFQDETTTKIGMFLMNNLNAANPVPNSLIVASFRIADTPNIPISDYPLLIVKRMNNRPSASNKGRYNIVCDFFVTIPNVDGIPPFVNWLEKRVTEITSVMRMMIDVHIDLGSRSSDFKLNMFDFGNYVVYKCFRYSFQVVDGSCC
jgi:hypothetical protein